MPCFLLGERCRGGLLAVGDVAACLGPLDRLIASEKEAATSRRVALAVRDRGAGRDSLRARGLYLIGMRLATAAS